MLKNIKRKYNQLLFTIKRFVLFVFNRDFVHVGRNCRISSSAKFQGTKRIFLGDNVIISDSVCLLASSKLSIESNCEIGMNSVVRTFGGEVTIGKNSSLNLGSYIIGSGGVIIGEGVRIGPYCIIIASNHEFCDPEIPIFKQGMTCKGITIKDNVWLGANVKILDGVTIGEGSVIGAGAVVTKSIPPFSVAVGVPAKVIRNRRSIIE